jgi:hypothetical protein
MFFGPGRSISKHAGGVESARAAVWRLPSLVKVQPGAGAVDSQHVGAIYSAACAQALLLSGHGLTVFGVCTAHCDMACSGGVDCFASPCAYSPGCVFSVVFRAHLLLWPGNAPSHGGALQCAVMELALGLYFQGM